MDDLISIIIPVYNKEKYIGRCIDSILSQVYEFIEIIVIDDGSSDSSRRIIEARSKKDNRIKYYYKKNGGVSSARNMGLKKASGKYIMFIDADDYVDADYINAMHNTIVTDDVDIVVSAMTIISDDKKQLYGPQNEAKKRKILDILDSFILDLNYISVWKKIFKSSSIKNIRFNESLEYGEDMLFSFESFKNTIFSYLPNYGYHYVQNNDSVSHSYSLNKIKKHINDFSYVCSRILDKYPDKKQLLDFALFSKINVNMLRLLKGKSIKYKEFKQTYNSITTKYEDIYNVKYIKELSFINRNRVLIYYLLNKTIYSFI